MTIMQTTAPPARLTCLELLHQFPFDVLIKPIFRYDNDSAHERQSFEKTSS